MKSTVNRPVGGGETPGGLKIGQMEKETQIRIFAVLDDNKEDESENKEDESEEEDPGLTDAHEELMVSQYWGSRGVNY